MVANEQIKQIASRIIYMRETLELSQQDVAEKIDMPLEEYIAYETGEKDLRRHSQGTGRGRRTL